MMRSVFIALIALAIGLGNGSAQTSGDVRPNLQSMTGAVKAVTPVSLTIERGGNDIAFSVDSSTRVIAKGKGAQARDLLNRERPKQRRLTELVNTGDQVAVRYETGVGTMNAVEVRVLRRSALK
jgi:hypothetical protein